MINPEEYNYKERKNDAVRYALDKMEAPASAYKRPKNEKAYSEQKSGNVLVRAAQSIFPTKGDSKGEVVRKLFLIVAVVVLVVALIILISQLSDIDNSKTRDNELASIVGAPIDVEVDMDYVMPQQIQNPIMTEVSSAGTEEPEYIDLTPVVNKPLNINWEKLWSVNPDVKAWIKLTGTLINYPVLQSTDNDYYLTHSVENKESISGAIFSSYRNTWDGSDDNTILFGHNMKAGTYFSYLVHYVPNDWSREPLAFYKVHPTIQMATPDGKNETFKIFAGIIANTDESYGDVFPYVSKTKFANETDFNNYMIEVMDRSWFFTDVDLTYGDDILTMSTCWWPLGRKVDTRWVVFARRVRDGESTEVDTTVAKRNYGARLFDYYYKIIGGKWRGSTWDKSKLLSYKREE